MDFVDSVFVAFNFLLPLGNRLFQSSPADELLADFDPVGFHILADGLRVTSTVVGLSESLQNVGETAVLLLHLLMVAPALLGLSGLDELFHGLEYLVHPPHVLVQEVLAVDFEEPVISLIFLVVPMAPLETLGQRFRIFAALLGLLFAFVPGVVGFGLGEGRVRSDVTYGVLVVLVEKAGQDLVIGGLSLGVGVEREGQ